MTDEAALAAFFEENNCPEVTACFHPFPLNSESARRICHEPRRDQYFAAWQETKITGMAMLRGWDEGFAVPSFGILVHRQSQGRGVGRALTEHALKRAQELRAPRVRLTVHQENTRAVALYEQTGFVRAEELPDGRLVMFRELNPTSA